MCDSCHSEQSEQKRDRLPQISRHDRCLLDERITSFYTHCTMSSQENPQQSKPDNPDTRPSTPEELLKADSNVRRSFEETMRARIGQTLDNLYKATQPEEENENQQQSNQQPASGE